MDQDSREIELKFEVDRAMLDRLKQAAVLKQWGVGRASTRTLRSVYFDTEDQRLFKAKIVLRVRKVGRRWVQTVKAGTAVSGGLSSPEEFETPVSGDCPDVAAIDDQPTRERLRDLLDGDQPAALFETVIRRTTRDIETPDGSLIEAAFDSGEVIHGKTAEPMCEVELELKKGRVKALYDLARELFEDTPVRFSAMSKSARGYQLARSGSGPEAAQPLRARQPEIDGSMTAELALRSILRASLEQIAGNLPAVLGNDDAEGPHQLRIGLRRLRSALKFFKPLVDGPAARALNEEARWLGTEVGSLRDADVLIADIVAPVPVPHGSIDMGLLTERLEKAATRTRLKVRKTLATPRISTFLLDLGAFIETRGWIRPEDFGQTALLGQPVGEFSNAGLDKLWKKARKRAGNLAQMSVEERHELRKLFKTLRYAVEFFSGLHGKENTKLFLKQLKRLQNVFGYLNDVALAGRLPDALRDEAGDGDVQRGIGFVLGWHQARADAAWETVGPLWEEADAAYRVWRKLHHDPTPA